MRNRIQEIDNTAIVSSRGCTYNACNFTIIRGEERLDVDNAEIKKYGPIFADDDIIFNHVGDTLTINYKLLDEEFHEIASEIDYMYLSGQNNDNVVFNGNKVTFNAPGYYEIHVTINGADGEYYFAYLSVFTDAQALIDETLGNMNSFVSDRSGVSANTSFISALETNLKNKIFPSYYYSVDSSKTAKVANEDSKYNVNFTLKFRDKTLTFKKDNLLVSEGGIAIENIYNLKMDLTDKKTYQVNYTLYSNSAIWTSSNPSVATVSSTGLITALKGGATLIEITTPDGEPQDFIVLVEDNGETKTRLTNTLNNIFGNDREIYVPAISDLGETLEDEIYFAAYEAIENKFTDNNMFLRITEVDENYRYVKIRLGYEILLINEPERYRSANYCKIDEYDEGFDCATDEVTLTIKYEDDKAGFDNTLKAKATELANRFDSTKMYVSNTNKNIKDYLANPDHGYAEIFYANANLDESIPNNDGFGIITMLGFGGWDYFPAKIEGMYALLARDGVIYRVASTNLKVKQVLTVKKQSESENAITAITRTVREIVGAQEAQIKVVEDKHENGAYIITIDRGESSKLELSTFVEFTLQEQQELNIRSLSITGVVAPVEGEHPDTSNIQITTSGVKLKNAFWQEHKENGRKLTESDTFVADNDAKYMLHVIFDLEDGYEIENPEINSSARAADDEFVGCPPEQPCVSDLEVRLYYGVKSKEPAKITAVPHIDISNDNNTALKLDIAYDQNATRIEIYRATSSKGTYTKIATVEEGTYKDSALTYGTTYYYKVRVCNTVNCSAYSNIVSGKIVPNKVEGLNLLSVSTDQAKLGWTKFNDVFYYELSKSTSKTGKYTVVGTVKDLDNYTNTKLAGNTTYYYKVRAYKLVGKTKVYGAYSDIVTVKTSPVAPTISISANDYDSLNLKVNAVKGATRYEIYRSLDKTDYEKVKEMDAAGSYKDEKLVTGKVYYYKVRACAETCGNYSSVVSKASALKTPSITLSVNANKRVSVKITEVNGADGYEVYRSLYKNKKFALVGTTEELEYIDEVGLNTRYYYEVRAYKVVDEKKVYGGYSSVKYASVTLSTPSISTSKKALRVANIKINAVAGAAGYEIYRSTNKNKGYTLVSTTTDLENENEINLNTTYYYKVRAFILSNGKKYYSSYSNIKGIQLTLGVPAITVSKVSLEKAKINITAVADAEGYEIYRSLYGNKKFTKVGETEELEFVDEINPNTKYYYKVRAFVTVNDKKNYGNYSSVKSIKLVLDVPKYEIERTGLNKASINITAVDEASGYEIYRSLYKNKKFVLVKTVDELTYEDTLNPNTTYYYKVRAYVVKAGKKYYSDYSSVKSVKLALGIPTYTLDAQEGQVEVKINELEYVEGFEVYRATSKTGKYTKLGETTELSYNAPAQANKVLYYKLRAYNTVNGKRVYGGYSIIKSAKALVLALPE